MNVNLKLYDEDILMRLRDKLRQENIKLWIEPYYDQTKGPCFDEIQKLAERFGDDLNIPLDKCYEVLYELQENALDNLKQKTKFNESGLATLKIKIVSENAPPRIINKELMLSMRGMDLKEMISSELNLNVPKLKLISAGKVINDTLNLFSQNIKNGQHILAVVLTDGNAEMLQQEQQLQELEEVKSDTRLLAEDHHYMALEDQFGNAVRIPKEERKALLLALALHEKGRSALKRQDYSRALVFFLEADAEFSRCTSKILDTVDNYALLDLDIAWCYLCLQSVAHLPEASERLQKCEARFKQTYGDNLERLLIVKGTVGNEAALFMRLHLLQGIVLYHKNQRQEAKRLLKLADEELSNLQVDENSIVMLVELGFTIPEARLALRANNGDVNLAANFIKENRDRRKEMRKKAKKEAFLEKQKKELGKCADGKQYVDPNFLKILINMGFHKEAARCALQKTNNVISDSIQYIQDNPVPMPSTSRNLTSSLYNELLSQLEAAGFSKNMCISALKKHKGDLTAAFEDLLAHDGILSSDSSLDDLLSSGNLEEMEQKQEAFKRLAEDITMVDDDHLDLTLEKEEEFLRQYLSMLTD